MLSELSLEEFMRRLSAGTPTPGGGSAAALASSAAASLLVMVADLTLGREAYRAQEEAVAAIRSQAEGLRRDLLALVDRDASAYDGVVQALRLPKGTGAEKEMRAAALDRATMFATETPLATAESSAALMVLAKDLAARGNPNAVSDVGVAGLLAYAAVRGAVLNVRVNLKGKDGEPQAGRSLERVRRLEVEAERLREEILGAAFSRLGSR